ncbi:MAG: hypothetical protein M3N93_00395, partial [Acidobacteriota bacterium]|nr:hypothetical protein [Acidobacteriota bacterium]
MTIIVPHKTTAEKAIAMVDRSADALFEGAAPGAVELTDRKKSWKGPIMDFSLTARVGFISLPIAGTVAVDAANVTVNCELPALVKNFIGEDRIRSTVEGKVRALCQPK